MATKDTELLSPPGMGGCLDTGDLKEALTGEPPAGSFQQGLERSRLENRMGEILRRVHRDPNAQVYLCPGEGPELKYNVVSSQAVSAIANKTHKPADWVKRIFDRGFLESQCRRVPKVDVAHLHDSIPPGLLVFLLKHLPDLEGKPFPPQAEPDLNLTAPIEPAEPEKPTPPLM
ncbi:MAG: hypothetical protein GWM98_26295 [Nitrospinaceae bacterium]|nr:hypothetical protein [Nitrospinaceae bacterium]NIR57337.1 hypothetical protein [Nitrospinaceae bacterium]NIS87789.1 hypothetical protein [Nitrospinaceae bacterium]NIT84659.1 hypothetical protein [Nitrospinaceae bacterium]NIU46838.1 hypothetical protein [Nitrospinaceae bacterium]